MDNTPFQLPINPRTKHYISHQFYRVLNNNTIISNNLEYIVVATTRQNSTCSLLTLAKLSVGYLVVWITRELDKEPLLYCYPIYISYKWSMLQQCIYCALCPKGLISISCLLFSDCARLYILP